MSKALENFKHSSRNFLPFMGFKGLINCSLRPTMVPTLGQMNPTHTVPVYAFKNHLIISSHLCISLPNQFFLSVLPTKAMYIYISCHMCATCPTHLTLLHLIFLIISNKNKKSRSLPLSHTYFRQHPVFQTPSVFFSQSDRPGFITIQNKHN